MLEYFIGFQTLYDILFKNNNHAISFCNKLKNTIDLINVS